MKSKIVSRVVAFVLCSCCWALHANAAPFFDCGTATANVESHAHAVEQKDDYLQEHSHHPVPYTWDMPTHSNGTHADKLVTATCEQDNSKTTIHLASKEWGLNDHPRNGDIFGVNWAPEWQNNNKISIPAGSRLSISVSSNVHVLSCLVSAPGTDTQWSRTNFSLSKETTVGTTSFDVTLSCSSGGPHQVSPLGNHNWVNYETIDIVLSLVS